MPVIFLTGHGDVPTSVEAMKLGALDFLEKAVAVLVDLWRAAEEVPAAPLSAPAPSD